MASCSIWRFTARLTPTVDDGFADLSGRPAEAPGEYTTQRIGEVGRRAIHQIAVDPVHHRLPVAGLPDGHHRRAAGHRFEWNQAEGLELCRHHGHARGAVEAGKGAVGDAGVQPELHAADGGQGLDLPAVTGLDSLVDEVEGRSAVGGQQRQRLHHEMVALRTIQGADGQDGGVPGCLGDAIPRLAQPEDVGVDPWVAERRIPAVGPTDAFHGVLRTADDPVGGPDGGDIVPPQRPFNQEGAGPTKERQAGGNRLVPVLERAPAVLVHVQQRRRAQVTEKRRRVGDATGMDEDHVVAPAVDLGRHRPLHPAHPSGGGERPRRRRKGLGHRRRDDRVAVAVRHPGGQVLRFGPIGCVGEVVESPQVDGVDVELVLAGGAPNEVVQHPQGSPRGEVVVDGDPHRRALRGSSAMSTAVIAAR